MAITKIICINETNTGNPGNHLKQALEYIINPEKTNNNILVGGINCLPETAFEQMIDTKVTYSKTNKRQGYHIIISFVPGEATEEMAYDIVERFAREYLNEEYEAVYAVHNDKNHMHAHLIFNSVNLVSGAKYEYRKGEWKCRIQPITNKLCKEYKLEIMPAEYSKNPKNLSRTEWEQEKQFEKMILADAIFCQSHAGNKDHFIFLMKRIGYQFEGGKYLSVKVPGGKWYHQLAKLDERFGEKLFKNYLSIGYSSAKFISTNPTYFYRSGLSNFQSKYYHKMYQIRMVEQKRFDVKSAIMAKELQRFHQLQKEYLFLVDNDIRSMEELVRYELKQKHRIEDISERQKEIYKETGVKKRACYMEEDIRDFQMWHIESQEKLDALKLEKREIKEKLKIVKGCWEEYGYEGVLDLISVDDEITKNVEVPEYIDGNVVTEDKKDVGVYDEIEVKDMDVKDIDVIEMAVKDDVCNEKEGECEHNVAKVNYEEFKKMSPAKKAEALGIKEIRGIEEIYNEIKLYFKDSGIGFDEIIDEAQEVYKELQSNLVKERAREIASEIKAKGIGYQNLTNKEKAKLFQFTLDNKYNLELHMAVLKECGVELDFDEVYEDYQGIYEKMMEVEKEKRIERGERKR